MERGGQKSEACRAFGMTEVALEVGQGGTWLHKAQSHTGELMKDVGSLWGEEP